jgi:hypothetical protein
MRTKVFIQPLFLFIGENNMTTTTWYYNNDNDLTLITEDMLKYATIKADDCCTGISNLMSACGISFDEAAESVLKL